MTRVANVTGNATNTLTLIKFTVRGYRASETSAKDVVETFFHAFNDRIEVTGTILSALADILDNEEKKTELLRVWNNFKVEVSAPRRPAVRVNYD